MSTTIHRTRLVTLALTASLLALTPAHIAHAETCTTQSGLSEPDRTALAGAARTLADKILANDTAALRTLSVADVQQNFTALQYLAGSTAAVLTGATPTVEQVYLLDATSLKRNADGTAPDAQFFCSLNRSTMEADFLIPALPPGKYAFAMINVAPPAGAAKPAPWRLSFLLRQEPVPPTGQPKWLLAGFYPKPLTAAGHDGLWYWTQARQLAKDKQLWNAWLYYQAAAILLRPADFVLSSHLDKLHTEQTAAAPPVLSEGVSVDAPLVVKAANGDEFHFTSLTVLDSGQPALDIVAHFRADPPAGATAAPDPAAARKRNNDATLALLTAYPELRKPFHGISIFADTAGQPPFATSQPMADIK